MDKNIKKWRSHDPKKPGLTSYERILIIINNAYNGQISRSKQRNHPLPEYTKDEFRDWYFKQPNLYRLVNNWINSGFNKDLIPSVVRINHKLHYKFDNIQLITWKENEIKGHLENDVNYRPVEVYKYNEDNYDKRELYKEFPCAAKCDRYFRNKYKKLYKIVKGFTTSRINYNSHMDKLLDYIFVYKDMPNKQLVYEEQRINIKRARELKAYNVIIRINMETNEWVFFQDGIAAARSINTDPCYVYSSAKNKHLHNGYLWLKEGELKKDEIIKLIEYIKNKPPTASKAIIMFDFSGKLIKEFQNSRDAVKYAKSLGLNWNERSVRSAAGANRGDTYGARIYQNYIWFQKATFSEEELLRTRLLHREYRLNKLIITVDNNRSLRIYNNTNDCANDLGTAVRIVINLSNGIYTSKGNRAKLKNVDVYKYKNLPDEYKPEVNKYILKMNKDLGDDINII